MQIQDNMLHSLALPDPDSPIDENTCQLLGAFSLAVQACMGILVLLSLAIKRAREKPKRKWKIFVADVSKQVLGQAFVHTSNVFLSEVTGSGEGSSACTYYVLNILIDTTIGVAILFGVLKASNWFLVTKLGHESFKSGKYGNPFEIARWAKQLGVYIFALTSMKICVTIMFLVIPGIFRAGDWLLSWLGDNSHVRVLFSVMIFPIIMNIFQFLAVDTMIRHKTPRDGDLFETEENTDRARFLGDEELDSDAEDLGTEEVAKRTSMERDRRKGEELRVNVTSPAMSSRANSPVPPSAQSVHYPPPYEEMPTNPRRTSYGAMRNSSSTSPVESRRNTPVLGDHRSSVN